MKRFIKFFASAAVFAWDKLADAARRVSGAQRPPRVVVIYYHAIDEVQRQAFKKQMEMLSSSARVIKADYKGELEPGRLYAIVTFDDGFESVLQNALPVMQEQRIPATLFVPTGCFGEPPCWVKNPEAPARKQKVMTVDKLARLGSNEWITIGAHTITHPRLSRLSESEAARELGESKAVLESVLRRPVEVFSFPHGDHTPELLELARNTGYSRVFTISPQCHKGPCDAFVMGRVQVEPDDSPLEFLLKIRGAYRWLAAV